MQRGEIKCGRSGESLKLKFPQHKDDIDSDYTEIVMHCSPSSRQVAVYIGAYDKNIDRLAISVFDERAEGKMEVNYFETNVEGEIIGHSKQTTSVKTEVDNKTIMHR